MDRKTVEQYCSENNRAFLEKAWESAGKNAMYDLNNDKIWLNPMTPPEEKEKEKALVQARAFLR